jgi:hypothetical protein
LFLGGSLAVLVERDGMGSLLASWVAVEASQYTLSLLG